MLQKALVIPALGLLMTGCTLRGASVSYDDHPRRFRDDRVVVVDGPPLPVRDDQVVVVQAPPPQPAYVIRREPPPPRLEQVPPPPGPGFVWVGGYWVADRDRWEWVRGHYDRPPRRGAVWVAPRWERQGDAFHFSLGFWK